MTWKQTARLVALPLLAAIAITIAATANARWGHDRTAPGSVTARVPGIRDLSRDSIVSLAELAARIESCAPSAATAAADRSRATSRRSNTTATGCTGAIYVWSPAMPLSRSGLREIAAATRDLGISLAVVRAGSLHAYSTEPHADTAETGESGQSLRTSTAPLDAHRSMAARMMALGATVHYPAALLHRNGKLYGRAIVGYKTAEAYRAILHRRFAEAGSAPSDALPASKSDGAGPWLHRELAERTLPFDSVRDYVVRGSPGAYFRFIPGRNMIAFESSEKIYLLDLVTGDTTVGPGFIDLIPSPDGQIFVTPQRNRAGLAFYNAAMVIEAAKRGAGHQVEPIFVDAAMRDQYPSVGVLGVAAESRSRRTTYRVLTSWFDKVVLRDYEVTTDPRTGRTLRVRPLGPPRVGCPSREVSLPIMAQNGRELAGRDESTGTTKIFRLADDGRCSVLLDLEAQTGKVAWSADGRHIAFSIPVGVRNGRSDRLDRPVEGRADESESTGVFVFDRDEVRVTLVRGGEHLKRPSFPEFVGPRSIVFLLRSDTGDSSVFRIVCCI